MSVLIILKNSEDDGMEEIGLVPRANIASPTIV